MQDNTSVSTTPQPTSSSPTWFSSRWIVVFFSILLIFAGGRTGWWAWNQLASNPDVPTEQAGSSRQQGTASDSGTPSVAPISTVTTTAYLLNATDTSFNILPITLDVEASDNPSDILDATFNQLLSDSDRLAQGSPATEQFFSAIPANTTLLDVTVEDDGVYVDLSAEFEEGGGSASMTGRLGQVIYTATSLDPSDVVWLSVEGAPLELLGGEGLEVFQPMTRSDFDQNYPL